jgi:response regulator RpfG family c-di-GMP phosphodiesterase
MSWQAARTEIVSQKRKQFDPDVIDAFVQVEDDLRDIRREVAAA